MKFGEALQLLEYGHSVFRTGWNGKGMFLYLVPEDSYAAQTAIARKEFGDFVPYGAYIAIKTVQGTVEPGWRPTTMDMLADDWQQLD